MRSLTLLSCTFALLSLPLPAFAQTFNWNDWATTFQTQVKSQWKPPAEMSKEKISVKVRINHGGLYESITFGDTKLSEQEGKAISEAVRKASPFKALPEEVSVPVVQVDLTLSKNGTVEAQATPKTAFLGLFARDRKAGGDTPASALLTGWGSKEAESSPLRLGDFLLEISGKPITKSSDISDAISDCKPGEVVTLKVKHGKQDMEVPLALTGSTVPTLNLETEEAPKKVTKLQPLPPSTQLTAEQIFGWGNVLAVQPSVDSLSITVGPIADETTLKEETVALFKQLKVRNLTVQVEAPEATKSWLASTDGTSVTVKPSTWRENPRLKAGTYLPIRLDIQELEGIRQGVTKAVTGKLLVNVNDENGVPLLIAETVVIGNMVPAPPFGHRFVLSTIGSAKTPIEGESEVLPTPEILIGRAAGPLSAYASVLYEGQVIGVPIQKGIVLPEPEKSEYTIAVPFSMSPAAQTQKPNKKKALELYNQAIASLEQEQWKGSIDNLQASLGYFPSLEAREALGWAYERSGQRLLKLDDTPAAISRLELALHLRSRVSNSLRLLSCSYRVLISEVVLPEDELQYLRHNGEVYGLSLDVCSPKQGVLLSKDPMKPAKDDYLTNVQPEYGSRRATVRLTRLPIKVYIAAAPNPNFDEIAWSAAQQWEQSTKGVVQFVRVAQPTDADIFVVFSANNLGSVLAFTETEFYDYNPRAFLNKVQAVKVNLNLLMMLGYRSPDQLPWLRAIAIHEFGHALGFLGHSDDRDDIMYPTVSGQSEISPRDILTMTKLYSTPPDITRP
ncbi:MAG: matrixin family metalloprotease [Anaerolineae bacterium]|nr:matrixin family metalloprotease [Gloeobacterales cyanobacterium ES-bin-313]